jgi:hypothetical protein
MLAGNGRQELATAVRAGRWDMIWNWGSTPGGRRARTGLRLVLGSGYRATVEALGQEQRDQLRDRLLGRLRAAAVTSLRTDVVFGVAKRPQ